MICPACEGEGCPPSDLSDKSKQRGHKVDECKDGKIDITECPLNIITEDVWQIIRFAELYENGLPPIAGGALDQAKVFIDASQFVMNEKAYWKAKLEIFD